MLCLCAVNCQRTRASQALVARVDARAISCGELSTLEFSGEEIVKRPLARALVLL